MKRKIIIRDLQRLGRDANYNRTHRATAEERFIEEGKYQAYQRALRLLGSGIPVSAAEVCGILRDKPDVAFITANGGVAVTDTPLGPLDPPVTVPDNGKPLPVESLTLGPDLSSVGEVTDGSHVWLVLATEGGSRWIEGGFHASRELALREIFKLRLAGDDDSPISYAVRSYPIDLWSGESDDDKPQSPTAVPPSGLDIMCSANNCDALDGVTWIDCESLREPPDRVWRIYRRDGRGASCVYYKSEDAARRACDEMNRKPCIGEPNKWSVERLDFCEGPPAVPNYSSDFTSISPPRVGFIRGGDASVANLAPRYVWNCYRPDGQGASCVYFLTKEEAERVCERMNAHSPSGPGWRVQSLAHREEPLT